MKRRDLPQRHGDTEAESLVGTLEGQPGQCDGCQTKGLARQESGGQGGKTIRKNMKTRGDESALSSGWYLA